MTNPTPSHRAATAVMGCYGLHANEDCLAELIERSTKLDLLPDIRALLANRADTDPVIRVAVELLDEILTGKPAERLPADQHNVFPGGRW